MSVASKAMPSLMFSVGESSYRLELRSLKSIAPWAELQPAQARGVLGWLALQTELVPVVDLRELLLGEPTPRCLGARILLLECGSGSRKRTVGALAGEVFSLARNEHLEQLERFNPCEVLGSILQGLA